MRMTNKELIERAVERGLIARPASSQESKPKTHVRKSRLARIMTDRRNRKTKPNDRND